MRVKIEHSEQSAGFLFKRPFVDVHLTVDFTHEEKQIIRQRRLEEQLLLNRIPANAKRDDDPDWYGLRVKHLFERRPDRHRCANPSEAKEYRAELEAAMRALKLWIGDNAELDDGVIFEL